MRALRIAALGCVSLLAFAACGGGDDDAASTSGTYGTCDLRSVQETCIEATGSAPSIVDQKNGCLQAKGAWSTNACPTTAELIGCCTYTFGNKYRECFYQGTPQTDPVGYCLDKSHWPDGVWTPAGM
jgi:hypothetical protein